MCGVSYVRNEDNSVTLNGTATTTGYPTFSRVFLQPGTYTFSGCVSGGYNTYNLYAYNQKTDGTQAIIMDLGAGASFVVEYPQEILFRMVINSGAVFDNITLKPQVELGGQKTEYEKYCGDTYTPNADGIVEGIKNIAPQMNIFADTEGVNIDCGYNADTKKYIDDKFAELQAAIVSTGGNV